MFLKLLAAFVLIPLAELFLLLRVAEYTGVWTTLWIVILTGLLGSILARREGVKAWIRFHQAMAAGRMPSREIQDGLMIVAAGALLLTPGLMTDAVGFALLLPAGREWIRRQVVQRYLRQFDLHVVNLGDPTPPDWSDDEFPSDRSHPDAELRDGPTIDAESYRRKS